ncbi:pseudouridine synthase [Butyriboletus roseoflavus]|nr:pseudouridine synthase [Butyriboletus roseoflavus]
MSVFIYFYIPFLVLTRVRCQVLSKRQVVLANLHTFKLQSREQLPLTTLSSRDQFRHVISRFITASMSGTLGQRQPSQVVIPVTRNGGLKKMPPYWYPYTTMAKERWLGREILEIVSTEFRDRSMEYYVATPVKIILHDDQRDFLVIDKPGSIPVHASGRYYRHSLVELLRYEFGFDRVYTINRLDRLTSGLMILPLNANLARSLTSEFMNGSVRKEYVARCKGEFPAEEVVCEEPLLTVDRQMGLNIVHPEGKLAKTIFNKLHYDANTDTSVLRCRPFTGRSHQIRVHLQYLGHPIANDPVYSEERIWGPNLGKNGIDVIPSSDRFAPAAPEHLKNDDSPESLATGGACIDPKSNSSGNKDENNEAYTQQKKLLPRETGHDIGMGSPVPLSAEAVQIITRLRNMKDEDEDWSRWRDVVFRAKGSLTPKNFRQPPPLPPPNKRKRGGRSVLEPTPAENDPEDSGQGTASTKNLAERPPTPPPPQSESSARAQLISEGDSPAPLEPEGATQLTLPEATSRLPSLVAPGPEADPATGTLYCPECYLPLHPDPKPERLYIFLHALKYELSLGRFETEMPEWAKEGWEWGR